MALRLAYSVRPCLVRSFLAMRSRWVAFFGIRPRFSHRRIRTRQERG